MLKVGLTGGIGSGKSTVSALFEKLGVAIIDTDIITHQLLDNNKTVQDKIIQAFGVNLIIEPTSKIHLQTQKKRRKLDRKKLAKIVFNNPSAKQQLENILHPKIRQQVLIQFENLSNKTKQPYIIIVVPLLFETDFHTLVDKTLLVFSNKSTRIKRISQRDSRSYKDIESIINSQINTNDSKKRADDILENNSDIENLIQQVFNLHQRYLKMQ